MVSKLYKNDYSPQAQWILLNNPLHFVLGIFQQYSPCLKQTVFRYVGKWNNTLKNVPHGSRNMIGQVFYPSSLSRKIMFNSIST